MASAAKKNTMILFEIANLAVCLFFPYTSLYKPRYL